MMMSNFSLARDRIRALWSEYDALEGVQRDIPSADHQHDAFALKALGMLHQGADAHDRGAFRRQPVLSDQKGKKKLFLSLQPLTCGDQAAAQAMKRINSEPVRRIRACEDERFMPRNPLNRRMARRHQQIAHRKGAQRISSTTIGNISRSYTMQSMEPFGLH